MATRRAYVTSIPRGDEPERQIGMLVDPGDGRDPFGTNPTTDDMLRADPRERFERAYGGYSNGYTYRTEPDIARTHPDQWQAYLQRVRDRQAEPFDQFVSKLGSKAA